MYGDAGKEIGLILECVTSKLYDFKEQGKCQLALKLPFMKVPWMLLLKTSCIEGSELAAHSKHYGMKVVGTGN